MEDCDIEKLRILIEQTEELVEIFKALQEKSKHLHATAWSLHRELEHITEKYDDKLLRLRIDLCTPELPRKKKLNYSPKEKNISGKINILHKINKKEKCPISLDQIPITNARQKHHHQRTQDSPSI